MDKKTTITNLDEMKIMVGAHEIIKKYKKGDTLIVMHVSETEDNRTVGGAISLNVNHIPEMMQVIGRITNEAISDLAEKDPMEAAKILAKLMVDQKMKEFEKEKQED